MKRGIFYCILTSALLLLSGCAKQTELSTDILETKVTVMGYVRYIATDKNLKAEEPELVDVGTPVNIFYGVPKEGKVEAYALKTVTVDDNGFFMVKLGCPVGKSLEVKVESSMYGTSYTTDKDSKKASCDAYFFVEKTETISCGSAHCFELDMVAVAYYGEDGYKQP